MILASELGTFSNPRFMAVVAHNMTMDGTVGSATMTEVTLVPITGTGSAKTQALFPFGGSDPQLYRAVFDMTDRSVGRYAFVVKKGTSIALVLNFSIIKRSRHIISAQAVSLPDGEVLVYETDDGAIKKGVVKE